MPQVATTVFRSESALVGEFVRHLRTGETPFGRVSIVVEFEYIRGRTDVVAIDAHGRVLAFEMKLKRWMDALHQAYRNRCFAHASYVVMPTHVQTVILRHRHMFERRGVGICLMGPEDADLVMPAARGKPLQPALTARAVALAQE